MKDREQPTRKNKKFTSIANMSEQMADNIQDAINYLLITQKVYLIPNYTAADMAKRLSITKVNLSIIIAVRFKSDFRKLIHEYRIKEACNILKDRRYRNMPIQDIAAKVGYYCTKTFNTVFKRFMKVNAYTYRKNNVNFDFAGYRQRSESKQQERKSIKEVDKPILTPQVTDVLENSIIYLIVARRVYRDAAFTIEKMAEYLQTNIVFINEVIRTRFNSTYERLMLHYRLKEVCCILKDSNCKKLTLNQISNIVGLNAKSLYRIFFNNFGMTPDKYRKKPNP